MKHTESKLHNMTVGQTVSIPSANSGTWNGVLLAISPATGKYSPKGEAVFTIRHENGQVNAVTTNLEYTGYIHTKDVADMTDDDVAQAMGTTTDDQRAETENANGRMSALDKMTLSSQYGKTEAEMVTDAVSAYPATPDYADVQKLENLAWSMPEGDTSYQEYAREYHKLATQYTEDVLILCIEQYYNGSRW